MWACGPPGSCAGGMPVMLPVRATSHPRAGCDNPSGTAWKHRKKLRAARHAHVQVACLRHFQSEPLSALTPAAAEGPEALAQACERLPVALRNSLTGSAARQSVARAAAAWRCWAVSIRWLHAAAQALGMGHSAGQPCSSHLQAVFWMTAHLHAPISCRCEDLPHRLSVS